MASVLAIILNSNEEILLIRRPGEMQYGTSTSGRPGQWCVPGGKIKKEECPEEAVVREVREEVGLSVFPIRRLADFVDQCYYHCSPNKGIQLQPNPRECSAYAWVSPANILSIGFISDFKRLRDVLFRLDLGTGNKEAEQKRPAAEGQ